MTAKLMSRLQVLVAIAFAVVALLAPLANAATVYVLGSNNDFGKFDLDGPAAFQYQLINADPGNGNRLRNLATDPSGGFYTLDRTADYLGRLSTAGNYTPIDYSGINLRGLSTDSSGTLYGYDYTDDVLGTLDTSTAAFTTIGSSGVITSIPPGMLAFLGANLYAVTNISANGAFFGVNTTTGAFTSIGSPNSLLFNANLFASPTTLYGINDFLEVFTINTATGVPTKIGDVTGASTNNAFVGAAMVASPPAPVPEIDPAGMGSVLALVTGALGLLEQRRRLKTA